MATNRLAVQQRQSVIAKNLQRLFAKGQCFEVRTLQPRGKPSHSGVFDDFKAAAANALAAELEGNAVYFGLNPLSSPPTNELEAKAKGEMPTDEDVAERRWLLVDCDPKKQAQGECSATDTEKKAAKAVLMAPGPRARRNWPHTSN